MKQYCSMCKSLWINDNSGEAYYKKKDWKKIWLKRGQGRPEWCPLEEVEVN